jgi:hypothetical protein
VRVLRDVLEWASQGITFSIGQTPCQFASDCSASGRIGAVQASQSLPGQRAWISIVLMSARPEEDGGSHDVIHLGGETAVVVPGR